jgi:hypothetical protein|tara:strand:+ start:244 stop:498 length:255 start_codon:yes stop_codon:yes gene_type:complete
VVEEKDKSTAENIPRPHSRGHQLGDGHMESQSTPSQLSLEQMIIAVGSFLYNSNSSITDIDAEFLRDLKLVITAELERREATTH